MTQTSACSKTREGGGEFARLRRQQRRSRRRTRCGGGEIGGGKRNPRGSCGSRGLLIRGAASRHAGRASTSTSSPAVRERGEGTVDTVERRWRRGARSGSGGQDHPRVPLRCKGPSWAAVL